ncbi:MAG: sulfotransferase family protein, partial [Candidatus Macondimonas sp.]
YFTERLWQWKVLEAVVPFARKFGPMARKLIWQRFHRGTMNNRAAAIAEYRRHVAEVQAAVPAERLLVFNVTQGWAPLCVFLDRPVPDQPYPRVNDKEAMQKEIQGMVKGAYAIVAVAGVGVLAVLALLFGLL